MRGVNKLKNIIIILFIIAWVSLPIALLLNIRWLIIIDVSLFGFILVISIPIGIVAQTETIIVGKNELMIKTKNGKEHKFPYGGIEEVSVDLYYQNADFCVKTKGENGMIRTYAFFTWPPGDVFLSKINLLSEKCKVYTWRWSRFWLRKKRWEIMELSSNWIPFEEREK